MFLVRRLHLVPVREQARYLALGASFRAAQLLRHSVDRLDRRIAQQGFQCGGVHGDGDVQGAVRNPASALVN
jgi:hypothetical protein